MAVIYLVSVLGLWILLMLCKTDGNGETEQNGMIRGVICGFMASAIT